MASRLDKTRYTRAYKGTPVTFVVAGNSNPVGFLVKDFFNEGVIIIVNDRRSPATAQAYSLLLQIVRGFFQQRIPRGEKRAQQSACACAAQL